jgi:hypothetical protein
MERESVQGVYSRNRESNDHNLLKKVPFIVGFPSAFLYHPYSPPWHLLDNALDQVRCPRLHVVIEMTMNKWNVYIENAIFSRRTKLNV